jgi:hypothetical protein
VVQFGTEFPGDGSTVDGVDGRTSMRLVGNGLEDLGIAIWVSYDRIEPLFRSDLNVGKRLSMQFGIANTILHEFAHVMGKGKFFKNGIQQLLDRADQWEFFFMDEQKAELGFSAENAVVFSAKPIVLENC